MIRSKSIAIVFLLFWVLPPLWAQSRQAQKVLDVEFRRFEAMTKADTAMLRDMLSEDLVYVHSNALKESKAEHIAHISMGKLVYKKIDRQEAKLRFYGKTALVNGIVNVQGILNGNAFEIRLLYSAVYRKKGKRWLLVNWQSTKAIG
ncbi:MAG: nuclear transport factor 2 family protein [Saprospiraceae bacterium]